MENKTKTDREGFFRAIYRKIFLIDDTPHRISLGFALGVLAGILPLTGPIAAMFLAFLFRVNRAAALLGSLLTNTWISIATFLLSIKIGSAIMGIDWHAAYDRCTVFIKNFRWAGIGTAPVFDILFPLVLGYAVISLAAGLIVYIVSVTVISLKKWKQRKS